MERLTIYLLPHRSLLHFSPHDFVVSQYIVKKITKIFAMVFNLEPQPPWGSLPFFWGRKGY